MLRDGLNTTTGAWAYFTKSVYLAKERGARYTRTIQDFLWVKVIVQFVQAQVTKVTQAVSLASRLGICIIKIVEDTGTQCVHLNPML